MEAKLGPRRVLVLLFVLASALQLMTQTPAGFDLVITNGHIIDGTGSPWYSGDVGIREGKVAAIGNLAAAPRKRTIDAAGKVVAPGFIDMLGQSELSILVEPRLPSKIYQGIKADPSRRSTMPSFRQIAPATSTTTSLPTGEPSASISPASKSKAWASTWPAMSAPRRSAASCWATTTNSLRPSSLHR
jgi:hypothetical protein